MTDKPQSSHVDIITSIGPALDEIEVFHNHILLGIYMRPGVTAGGVLLPDKTIDEDKFQGKVGVVLKLGPLAFQNDARNDFKGQTIKEGDWLLYRVSDGFSLDINGVHCRLLPDVDVKCRVLTPSAIY